MNFEKEELEFLIELIENSYKPLTEGFWYVDGDGVSAPDPYNQDEFSQVCSNMYDDDALFVANIKNKTPEILKYLKSITQEPQLLLHQLIFSGEGGNWVANHREISGLIETLIDVMDDEIDEKEFERCEDENDSEYIERLCFIINNRDTFEVNYSIDYV